MPRTNLTNLDTTQGGRVRNQAEEARRATEALIAQDAQAREDFATAGLPPDWIGSAAAGAGLGWIFGPVGGVLGYLIADHFQKRQRSGVAAQASADAETANSLIEGGAKTIARLRSAAETDQDHLEVDLLERQYEDAVALARNPRGSVAVKGFEQLLSIPGLASSEADEIEAATLARETREREQLEREQDKAIDLRNRLETESSTFIDAERQFANLQQILKGDPTTLDATTAIFTFAKLVNPGEITTEGDIESLSAGGGVSQALAARLQRVILGQDFMDDQIKFEMLEAGKDLMRRQRAEQVSRNQLARDFGQDLGIRDSLLENVFIPITTRPEDLVPIKLPDTEPPVEDTRSPARRAANETGDALREFFGMDPIEQTYVTPDGRELRRVDRGDGRFEWEPVGQSPAELEAERRRQETQQRARERRPTNGSNWD